MMKRLHLLEWEDQPWLPTSLRRVMIESLGYFVLKSQIYRPSIEPIKHALRVLNSSQILDLCSGSAFHLGSLSEAVGDNGQILMTDLFPNGPKTLPKNVRYRAEPLNARHIPEGQKYAGLRTIFSGFHHFRPQDAKDLMRQAIVSKQGLAIFEFTARTPFAFLQLLIGPFLLLYLAFARPSFARIFWTILLPLAPFCLFWDGVVSCLRTYSESDLQALFAELGDESKGWRLICGKCTDGAPLTYGLIVPS